MEGVWGEVSSGVGAATEGGSTTDTPRTIERACPRDRAFESGLPRKGWEEEEEKKQQEQ